MKSSFHENNIFIYNMLYIHPEATRNCKQHCERNCVQSEKSPKLVSKRNWPGMREAAPVLFPSSVFLCSFRFAGFSPAQRTSMIVVHLLLAATRRATDAQNNFLDLNADGSKSEISNYEIAQEGEGNCTWLISIFLFFSFHLSSTFTETRIIRICKGSICTITRTCNPGSRGRLHFLVAWSRNPGSRGRVHLLRPRHQL